MRKKGFAPVLIVPLIAIFGVLVYIGFVSFHKAQLAAKQNTGIQKQTDPYTPIPGCTSPITEDIPPYTNGKLTIRFEKWVSKEMQQPIINVFKSRPNNIFRSSYDFTATSSRIDGDWLLISILALDGPCYSSNAFNRGPFCDGTIIGKRVSCQEWEMAVIGTDLYNTLISESPDTFIEQLGKTVLIKESKEWASR